MKVSNKERSLTTRSAEMKKVTYPHCCLITALYLFVFTSELKFTKTSYQKVLPTDSQKKKKKEKKKEGITDEWKWKPWRSYRFLLSLLYK